MKTIRTDEKIATGIAKEFEALVKQIILIQQTTKTVYNGAHTIMQADFLKSIIASSDITSDIPTKLRTQSLKIVRKIIESENKSSTLSASEWETEDWMPFRENIRQAQNMLSGMNLITLICRVVAYEKKCEIREEAFLVGIAILLGGNNQSQMKFAEYIMNDVDNNFCRALVDLLSESYELVKKNQIKRN